jgi:Zn-finger nucleic acid-binding protein
MDGSLHELIQLELKYCERCGGLWLRRLGNEGVYCRICAVEMPEFRVARTRRSRARLPLTQKRDIHGRFTVIAALGESGGHA